MRQLLHCHSLTPCTAIARIDVELSRGTGREVTLTYRAQGAIANLRLPPPASNIHTDNLWQHTCFEAFVRAPGSAAYREFNFAPSGAWAAYAFTGYRDGMANADVPMSPRIETTASSTEFELKARVTIPFASPWRLSLTAVIEETNGNKSYWALAHPPGKPDFHHSDGFVLELD